MDTLISTDARGRVTIPNHPNERFIVRDDGLGTVVLERAVVVSTAQYAYDTDPALREMLGKAAASGTVRRKLERRPA